MSDLSHDPGLGPGTQSAPVNSRTLPAAPEGRSSEFVAVTGAEAETTSATAMLVTAYALFWVLLLGFAWMTWRRQQRLADRLKQIELRLANTDTGGNK